MSSQYQNVRLPFAVQPALLQGHRAHLWILLPHSLEDGRSQSDVEIFQPETFVNLLFPMSIQTDQEDG